MVFVLPGYAETPPLHHAITVTLHPEESTFTATDRIVFPSGFPEESEFFLHDDLRPSMESSSARMRKVWTFGGVPPHVSGYRLNRGARTREVTLQYGGKIVHPLESVGKETARGMKETAGIISDNGVFLSGNSYWYAEFPGYRVTAEIEVNLPEGWSSVSQGRMTRGSTEGGRPPPEKWEISSPQEELYLIAYRFAFYREDAGRVEAQVYLREPDDGLAARYLKATASYLEMYEKLIGPYPYSKFALVENFWETGYGMPSFTLLGPKIIRMPFILYSSYPHEILHNWWGNGVYPDYESGNWSEGLTAYLADHLIKEQQGQAADYRQTTLQKYADFVGTSRDFPLSAFTSRHSSSSEAIGYGKSLMFFHMLRQKLGDDAFVEGLRSLYRNFRFRKASWEDLRRSFESASATDLRRDFQQWVERTGAPVLRIEGARVVQEREGYRLKARILQVQPEAPYEFDVPLWVSLSGESDATGFRVPLKSRETDFEALFQQAPYRMDVDPEYDVFRRLHLEEIPPALSQVLGAEKMLVILPANEPADRIAAYRVIAEGLRNSGPERVDVKTENEVTALPEAGSVVFLGRRNGFLSVFQESMAGYPYAADEERIRIERTETPWKDHAFAVVTRRAGRSGQGLLWIVLDDPAAAEGFSRKLPHYHKYSYLGFEGAEPENILKGRWEVQGSPMSIVFADAAGSAPGKRPERKPLIEMPTRFSGERMMETIRFLSSPELKGRGYEGDGLEKAADYIMDRFRKAGLEPAGEIPDSYFQDWFESFGGREGAPKDGMQLRNVLGRLPGANPQYEGEAVIVAAHYDHLGLGWPDVRKADAGSLHPGADDNGSGVAVLLDLAEALRDAKPERSLIFIAFTGEEVGRLGSRHYLNSAIAPPAGKCLAMVNLDTVGRLGGGKLMVLGGDSAREWVHIFRGVEYVTGVEIQMVSEPLDSSDQASFHEAGIPAVQLFSGPHADYHTPRDEPERIDPRGLERAATVAKEAVLYIADRETPLEVTIKGKHPSTRPPDGGGRRVSLGTIPDFAFSEKGCRLTGVVPGSPAETCGLTGGDIIVRMNGEPVDDLRSMSRVLKSLSPGDRVVITFIRDGREMTVDAEVTER